MNFLKQSAFIAAFAFMGLPTVQAEEVATLPTIRVMAESELREEVGFVPFQEDKCVRLCNIMSIKRITIYKML